MATNPVNVCECVRTRCVEINRTIRLYSIFRELLIENWMRPLDTYVCIVHGVRKSISRLWNRAAPYLSVSMTGRYFRRVFFFFTFLTKVVLVARTHTLFDRHRRPKQIAVDQAKYPSPKYPPAVLTLSYGAECIYIRRTASHPHPPRCSIHWLNMNNAMFNSDERLVERR